MISSLRSAQADRFLRIVSGGTLFLAMGLVAAVAFLRGRPRMALIAAASVAAAVLTTEVLKLIILERPPLTISGLNGGENSYPSGHTTVGMSVCIAAMLVVPPRLRIPTALAAGAIGAAFGVAVVAAGWHRPSDAVGAYFVCLAVGAAAAILIRALPDRDPVARGRERIPGPVRIGSTELALAGMGAGPRVRLRDRRDLRARHPALQRRRRVPHRVRVARRHLVRLRAAPGERHERGGPRGPAAQPEVTSRISAAVSVGTSSCGMWPIPSSSTQSAFGSHSR